MGHAHAPAGGWAALRPRARGAGMNIVVNIRGRGGAEEADQEEQGFGLFGNGITAATAAVPPPPGVQKHKRTIFA